MIKAIKNLFKTGHTIIVPSITPIFNSSIEYIKFVEDISEGMKPLCKLSEETSFKIPVGAIIMQHESPYSAARSFIDMFNCRNDLNVSPEDTRFWC